MTSGALLLAEARAIDCDRCIKPLFLAVFTGTDNYFNLLPGETVEITAASASSLDALKAQMKVISLTDAFASDGVPAVITAGK